MDGDPRTSQTTLAEAPKPRSQTSAPLVRARPDAPATGSSDEAPGPEPQPRALIYLPYLVGVLALVAYAAFVLTLRREVGDGTSEQEWLRLTYLFTGVESIAFAAAGFFFGREVNRARAEQAEKRADSESRRAAAEARRADKAQEGERNGRELAVAVKDAAAQTGDAHAADPAEFAGRAILLHLAHQAECFFPSP
jgi:hypothetical protein